MFLERKAHALSTCQRFGLGAAVLLLAFIDTAFAQDKQGVKFGTAPLVDPGTPYYGGSTTSSTDLWDSAKLGRPLEIKQLARALRQDPDLIYEYVRNTIEYVPMYGVQKGALGALIDRSGTAFDQAHLMVELLRESGYSAQYLAGTITLDGGQTEAWLGSRNAALVAKVLANGGIPAQVSANAGDVSSLVVAHAWVRAAIPGSSCGTSCTFDPAYKLHTTIVASVDLAAQMQWNEADFLSSAQSGMSSGTAQATGASAAAPYVNNVNHTNIKAKLSTYSANLLGYLKAQGSDLSLDQMLGGRAIAAHAGGAVRQSSLPYPSTVQHTWTGNVPDQYRTTVLLELGKQFAPSTPSYPPLLTRSFYADEIYGRRTTIEPDPDFRNCNLTLKVDDVPLSTVDCFASHTQYAYQRDFEVRLTINHPYAAADASAPSVSGGYMDRQLTVKTNLAQAATIVAGFGDVSDRLLSKISGERRREGFLPTAPPKPDTIDENKPPPSGMVHTRSRMAAGWLGQFSRLLDLQARIAEAEVQHHHSLGVVALNVWAEYEACGAYETCPIVAETQTQISISSGLSIASISGLVQDEAATRQAVSVFGAALEGSLAEQYLDTPQPASTTSRFEWGNAEEPGITRFYLFNQANFGDGLFYGSTGSVDDPKKIEDYSPAYNRIRPWIDAGYWVMAANQSELGPGNLWHIDYQGDRPVHVVNHMHRGPAFIAFKPDSSEVAHIVTSVNKDSKGGGAGMTPEAHDHFDPKTSADLLKDQFKDRSQEFGIDLKTGDLTYAAPADLTVGNGGFPYELSFQRSFRGGTASSPGLAAGWSHNLDIRAAVSGSGLEAMGNSNPLAAASSLVALYVAQRLYSAAAAVDLPTLQRWISAPFVAQWWTTQLTYNVVTITEGASSKQFVRMADGTFLPPKGSADTLVQNGHRNLSYGADPYIPDDEEITGWGYSNVSFVLTKPNKETLSFAYWQKPFRNQLYPDPYEWGHHHGWHITNWSFPYGLSLTFTYDTTQGQPDRVVTVQNNLGRKLQLAYGDAMYYDSCTLNSVSDGNGRSAEFSCGATATSPVGAVSKYEYLQNCEDGVGTVSVYWYSVKTCSATSQRPFYGQVLSRIYNPSDPNDPKMEFAYDELWRVKTYKDAVAVKKPDERQPYQFFITGTSRGERIDPLLNEYTVYYDAHGRAIQFIDELGRRVTNDKIDGQNRVVERTFPEGNRVLFEYDQKHNLTRLTKVPKTLASPPAGWPVLGNIVLRATYHALCNRLASVTDARNETTSWTYDTTTCTPTKVEQPSVMDPVAGISKRPTTTFTYNAFGQKLSATDPTGVVASYTYYGDEALSKKGYRKTATLDPGIAPHNNGVTAYDYDAEGNIVSVTDPRSNVTTYVYDDARRLTKVAAPLGEVTENAYTPDGQIDFFRSARQSNPDPGNPAHWQLTDYSYTETGQTWKVTDPEGNATETRHDALDRPELVLQDVIDGHTRKTKTVYDPAGQVVQVIRAWDSADQINYATYGYTPNGQKEWVVDANGNKTEYVYDGHDRAWKTIFPSKTTVGGVNNTDYERYLYDAAGNLTSKRTRNGKTISFVYDALNREVTRYVDIGGPYARTLTTSYDLGSRKWDVTADGQTLKHRYDSAGRLDTVEDSLFGSLNPLTPNLGKLDYAYDKAGNRTQLTVNGGAITYVVDYAYDSLNRLDLVQEPGAPATILADYAYDTLSRRDQVTWGNGAHTDFSYEADDDLAQLVHTAGAAVQTFGYTHNKVHQITGMSSTDGTLLWRPSLPQSRQYTLNGLNQVTAVGLTTQSYDANGNFTSDGTWTYQYDEENRLRSATGAGSVVSYEYDPLGRRRAKTVNGTRTLYLSDDAEEIAEINSSGTFLRRYVYGAGMDERIAMRDYTPLASCNPICYYQTNHQGSTVWLTGNNQTNKATYHYGPYGEASDPGTGNPFRYTGRRYDEETGLYYYRARYYSMSLGRFLSTDLIGYKDDLNLYAYVGSDPVNNFDPNGQESFAVARRLDFPGVKQAGYGHAYTVTNASRVGDPKATIYSFGKLQNGAMGNVGDSTKAADLSATTAAADATHWESLGSDTTGNISKIEAPDAIVDAVAGAVSEGSSYAAIPSGSKGSNEVNSNSAAFAIGDRAEQISSGDPGAQMDRESFDLKLPGASESGEVKFNCTTRLKREGGC